MDHWPNLTREQMSCLADAPIRFQDSTNVVQSPSRIRESRPPYTVTHKGLQIKTKSLRVIGQPERIEKLGDILKDVRELSLNCSIEGSDQKLALIVCQLKGELNRWYRVSMQETKYNPSSDCLEGGRYTKRTIFLDL